MRAAITTLLLASLVGAAPARADVDVRPVLLVGATTSAGVTVPGTVVTTLGAAQQLTVDGLGFPADAPVTVKVEGLAGDLVAKNAGTQTDLVADASGAFRADLTLPGDPSLVAGSTARRTLTFTSGSHVRSVLLTRVAQKFTIVSPSVRPGGTLVVQLSGYRAISGRGQRVALVLNPGSAAEVPIGCADTDDTGSGSIAGTVPAGQSPGSATIGVSSGAACRPADGITQPLARSGQGRLTVSAAAPVLTSGFVRSFPGGSVPISGEGYAPGEVVDVEYDGATIGSPLEASAAGTISGTVTVPTATTLTGHRIVLNPRGTTTATGIVVQIRPRADVTATSDTAVAPGQTVSFSLTDFHRADGAGGQMVGVQLDDGALSTCVQTDADGSGAGSVTVPADTAAGVHELRFLSGSCGARAADEPPSRRLTLPFEVTAPPTPLPVPDVATPTLAPSAIVPTLAPAPTPAPTVRPMAPAAKKVRAASGGRSVAITLDASAAGKRVKVGARTPSRVRVPGERRTRIVVVATAKVVETTAGGAPQVRLRLTPDGRRLLRSRTAVKVVVTVQLAGHTAAKKTFTLR